MVSADMTTNPPSSVSNAWQTGSPASPKNVFAPRKPLCPLKDAVRRFAPRAIHTCAATRASACETSTAETPDNDMTDMIISNDLTTRIWTAFFGSHYFPDVLMIGFGAGK